MAARIAFRRSGIRELADLLAAHYRDEELLPAELNPGDVIKVELADTAVAGVPAAVYGLVASTYTSGGHRLLYVFHPSGELITWALDPSRASTIRRLAQ